MRFPADLSAVCMVGLLAGLASFHYHCGKPPELPEEAKQQYQADAARLCAAMVDCVKEDVGRQMAAHPERRDMVLGRMDRELCVKNQYRLIADLSVWPGLPRDGVPNAGELYALYSVCSKEVAAGQDCAARKRLHRENISCRRLRELAAAAARRE